MRINTKVPGIFKWLQTMWSMSPETFSSQSPLTRGKKRCNAELATDII